MINRNLILPVCAAFIVACGQSANGQSETEASDLRNDAVQPAFEALSGEYKPDARHRYITFSYSHFGYSHPHVRWRDWDATLNWNAENPENSSVSVTIDASSVDSGVDVFDGHLKGKNFFDTDNHPEITFASTALTKTGPNAGTMTGDLTIKGVTKPVMMNVTLNKGAYEERGNKYKLGFSASGTVNRSDFGLDYAVPAVGDEVVISVEAEFEMPAGE